MKKKLEISTNQFICLIAGYTLILLEIRYPSVVASKTNQNAWLVPFFSSIYPIIFFTLYWFIYKKHPKKNIFAINNILLGKFLGTIFNFTFAIFLFCYGAIHYAAISLIINTTIVWYYNILQMIFLITVIGVICAALFDIEPLLKISQISLYIVIFVYLLLFLNLRDGSITNILPILIGTSPKLLLKSTYTGIFMFAGFETFMIYLPYLKNKQDYKKIAISIILILVLITSWLTFVCVFYFGHETLTVFYFPVLNYISSIKVPIINNFAFIFIVLSSVNAFKNSSVFFFNFIYLIPEKFRGKFKYLVLLILAVPLYFATKPLTDMILLDSFINKVFLPLTLVIFFNIIILFIVTLRRNSNEKKDSI
ncbi:GerAB/ArcD/ProY family transporter [Clostridium baratii]|uniref:Protein GerKB3 n=1 Tax=Clostridium baratii TaxID=1561 RepID=A0A174PMC2_9CLOT|nr:GerAB/ArcD/ProY family transporter [Clostridium baratii]CUP62132.1 protein GerKB3 [Clostridium baratii]